MKIYLSFVIVFIIAFTAGYITATQKQKNFASQQVRTYENSQNITNKKFNEIKKESKNIPSLNRSLSHQLEQLNLPLAVSTTYPELLKKIDALPEALINTQLAQLFDEEYINQIKDTHKFSKDIIEIALTDENAENSNGLVNVTFSHSPVSGIRLIGQAVEIEAFNSIYAHIEPNMKLKNCIIKWRYLNSGNIILFKQMALNPDIQTQYVWMKPASGWKPGLYQVTVHDMSNNKQLVGSNTFQITKIIKTNKTSKSPDHDVINDLILNGQAIPKSN